MQIINLIADETAWLNRFIGSVCKRKRSKVGGRRPKKFTNRQSRWSCGTYHSIDGRREPQIGPQDRRFRACSTFANFALHFPRFGSTSRQPWGPSCARALLSLGCCSFSSSSSYHHLEAGEQDGEWTPSECCNQRGCVRLRAAFLRKSTSAALGECLLCLEFLP